MTPTPVTRSLFVFTTVVCSCTAGISLGQYHGVSNFKLKSAILTSKREFGRKLTWLSQNWRCRISMNTWTQTTFQHANRVYLARVIHYWSYFRVVTDFSGGVWFEPKCTVYLRPSRVNNKYFKIFVYTRAARDTTRVVVVECRALTTGTRSNIMNG